MSAILFNKFGTLPPKPKDVAHELSKQGAVKHPSFGIIFLGSMIPLLLGASVGPEASLVVFSIYLFEWASEKTKLLEKKLELEINTSQEKTVIAKMKNNYLYAVKVGVLTITTLTVVVFFSRLDKFSPFFVRLDPVELTFRRIVFIIILFLIGLGLGKFYLFSEKIIEQKLSNLKNNIVKSLLTGSLVFLAAILLPQILLSGEGTLKQLIESADSLGVITLLLVAFFNILLSLICINGNLRGGPIFPIIFSAVALGLVFTVGLGINATIAISAVMFGTLFILFHNLLGIFLLLTFFVPFDLLIIILVIVLIFKYAFLKQNKDSSLEVLEEEYELKR